jgi:cytochrome c556
MSPRAKPFSRTRLSPLLVFATILAGATAIHAESIAPVLHTTMRTMAASLSEIEAFANGKGEQAATVADAKQVVTLAKSIPGIFPPGSELTELPGKYDAPPTSWDDVDRFLEAQKHLVIETSKLLVTVNDGNKEAIGQQVANTRKACAACHEQFRN